MWTTRPSRKYQKLDSKRAEERAARRGQLIERTKRCGPKAAAATQLTSLPQNLLGLAENSAKRLRLAEPELGEVAHAGGGVIPAQKRDIRGFRRGW